MQGKKKMNKRLLFYKEYPFAFWILVITFSMGAVLLIQDIRYGNHNEGYWTCTEWKNETKRAFTWCMEERKKSYERFEICYFKVQAILQNNPKNENHDTVGYYETRPVCIKEVWTRETKK